SECHSAAPRLPSFPTRRSSDLREYAFDMHVETDRHAGLRQLAGNIHAHIGARTIEKPARPFAHIIITSGDADTRESNVHRLPAGIEGNVKVIRNARHDRAANGHDLDTEDR